MTTSLYKFSQEEIPGMVENAYTKYRTELFETSGLAVSQKLEHAAAHFRRGYENALNDIIDTFLIEKGDIYKIATDEARKYKQLVKTKRGGSNDEYYNRAEDCFRAGYERALLDLIVTE